jgi:Spy/CpxP family protein refolding chaperone
MNKFAPETATNTMIMSKKQKDEAEISHLKAELALLRRELEQERLKREAYQVMIKIAEAEFDIPIERKLDGKEGEK